MSRAVAAISIAGISAILVVACASAAPSAQFGVATQIADEPPCVIFPRAVAVGTPITLEAVTPRRTIRAWILRAASECAGNETVQGLAYLARVRRDVRDLGIVTATVSAHTRDLMFRQCASSEGIHLTVWRRGRRIWHEYYYVPYDLEPTCTEEETRAADR